MRDARERWHRSGQGLRRGILLGLRETAKSIAAGPELACGSDSRPCRNNAVSRSPSSNHPSSAAARPDATFLWRPSPSQQKKRHPAVPTLPDTETKTPVKQTYTIYNQHSLSAQLNYHQKVLSATQDRWPAL